jgi:phosphoglucosamine mutase
MSIKYFGTDGVRGRVGEHPITADFMLNLGRAAGKVLAGNDNRAVVIGKDTRISGYMFESALEAGLAWKRGWPRPAPTCSCSARCRHPR